MEYVKQRLVKKQAQIDAQMEYLNEHLDIVNEYLHTRAPMNQPWLNKSGAQVLQLTCVSNISNPVVLVWFNIGNDRTVLGHYNWLEFVQYVENNTRPILK